MLYVTAELDNAKGRKTPLAASVSALFRKCVRKAEEPQRVAGARCAACALLPLLRLPRRGAAARRAPRLRAGP